MANKTIPQLDPASALDGTEQIEAVQSNEDVRLTTQQIADYIAEHISVGPETPESIKGKYEENEDTNAYTDSEKEKLGAAVVSNPDGIAGASPVLNIVRITQSGYDALQPDAQTLYVVEAD